MNVGIHRLLLLVVLAVAGCGTVGPENMTRDRFNYSEAVAESWKSQMLLNLVKFRYRDTPVFLDVGQIVAGYSFSRRVSAVGSSSLFNDGAAKNAQIGNLGATVEGVLNDSPTITYAPLAGERFARSMMAPIPPSAILNVLQAGFSADVVFRLTVQSVNGVDNRRVQRQFVQPPSPEFHVLLRNLHRIQASGDIGVRFDPADKVATLKLVLRPNLAAAVENAGINIAKILGLDPATREFRVVYGAVPANDKEIAMLTRSIREVLVDLASEISVPEAHVAERRVGPTPGGEMGPDGPVLPLIRIGYSVDRPEDAFAAVPYRGYWFSIDDRDIASKDLFSFIMFLFTFVETGSREAAPILTIPTTR